MLAGDQAVPNTGERPCTRLDVVEEAALPATATAATIAAVQIVRPNIATTLRPVCDPAEITCNEFVNRPIQSHGSPFSSRA